MTTLFEISLGSAEPVDQEIPKTLLGAREIVGRIHRPEHLVVRNPGIEGRHNARNPLLANQSVNVVFLHKVYVTARGPLEL